MKTESKFKVNGCFFLTIALLTTDAFSSLWQNIREFPGLGVELLMEASPVDPVQPSKKENIQPQNTLLPLLYSKSLQTNRS